MTGLKMHVNNKTFEQIKYNVDQANGLRVSFHHYDGWWTGFSMFRKWQAEDRTLR